MHLFHTALRTLAVVALLLLPAFARANDAGAHKLNVLWIIADDLGYADLSCHGSKDIPTPHIDSLAHDGVKLTSAYAYPTCSPTRASLLTGQYAERFGVTGALMGDNPPNFGSALTIAQILKDNGYVTACVGKWHLGYTGDVTPLRKGFDFFYGFRGGKIDFFKHTDTAQKNGTPEGKHDFYDNDTEIFPTGQYTTDLFTNRACQLLKQFASPSSNPQSEIPNPKSGKPFFIYLAYNAPHYAKVGLWEAPDEYLKKFHAEGQTKGRGVYAAMVSCLDDGVGKVLATLHDLKLDDDTLVIFSSDNGGEGAASNAPFTGGKHKFTEGGLRIDQIWRLPGQLKPNSTSDAAIHVIDLAPTTLAAVSITPPSNAHFDGLNAWPTLSQSTPLPARALYLGNHALRKGNWKLRDGSLFDLAADVSESKDLAAEQPDVVADLKTDLNGWLKKLGIAAAKKR